MPCILLPLGLANCCFLCCIRFEAFGKLKKVMDGFKFPEKPKPGADQTKFAEKLQEVAKVWRSLQGQVLNMYFVAPAADGRTLIEKVNALLQTAPVEPYYFGKALTSSSLTEVYGTLPQCEEERLG